MENESLAIFCVASLFRSLIWMSAKRCHLVKFMNNSSVVKHCKSIGKEQINRYNAKDTHRNPKPKSRKAEQPVLHSIRHNSNNNITETIILTTIITNRNKNSTFSFWGRRLTLPFEMNILNPSEDAEITIEGASPLQPTITIITIASLFFCFFFVFSDLRMQSGS